MKEIGSEFWVKESLIEENNNIPEWINRYGETVLMSSGRGAISLLLQEIKPKSKTVLLPAYICDSVILPFVKYGYKCYFYDIKSDLSPDLDGVENYEELGVFVHMGYYGFATNSPLEDIIKRFKTKSTIVVEDITHTLFLENESLVESDYYIGSIRKWLGLPSGGFLASATKSIKNSPKYNNSVAKIREDALLIKSIYMENKNELLKLKYRYLFEEGERLLDINFEPYHIDELSKTIINALDVKSLKNKRRKNYEVLSLGIKNVTSIKPVFPVLDKGVCPLFYPIYVLENRNDIRKKLADEKIYCPIHWPVPDEINVTDFKGSIEIYNTVLSIPCDQRYGVKDMRRIISVLERK